MTGIVFDIKEFSLHDGPGPRTTVFLKGCPLRCRWCHNPEGVSKEPQLMIKHNLCTHCGACKAPCGHAECKPFSRCLHACAFGLVSVSGTEYTPKKLAEKLSKNLEFYKENGGGITFSGGEPLYQHAFLLKTVEYLDCSVALQTSGYAAPDVFKSVIDRMDYVMMDIKIADREQHKKYIGVYNDCILENFQYLKNSGKKFVVRTPLIPGICDTERNLTEIKNIIGDSPWEKLPENSFWQAKYSMLDKERKIRYNSE